MATAVATPSFADHTKDFANVVTPVLAQNDTAAADKEFLKSSQSDGRNQLLHLYELGGLYHLKGDFTKSAAFLDQADKVAKTLEGKAAASVSGGLGQVGAGLTNDTVLLWEGAPFDKVMSRTINALNYIANNDLEGAKVECKKAEEYQAQERVRIQGKVDGAGDKDLAAESIASAYGPMFSFVADVRNSFENAFTYYLSSQIYRAQGKDGLNDALVDIKQAYALAPDSPAIQAAYLDLAAQSAEGPDGAALLGDLKAKFGAGADWKPADPTTTGTVVVVYEAGFAPRLSEVKVNLRLPKGDLFSMAFPIYNEFGEVQAPLQIQAPAVQRTTTKLLDLRPLAVKNLKERMPAIITRSTLGAVAKIEVQKQAEKNFGFFGKLAAKVATNLVTNADLRSWLSLPSEVQAAQFPMAAGANEVTLAAYDWSDKVIVNVTPGATTFVTVRGVPGHKTISVTTVGAAGATPAVVPAAPAEASAPAPAVASTDTKAGA
jgi:hypothetical protein